MVCFLIVAFACRRITWYVSLFQTSSTCPFSAYEDCIEVHFNMLLFPQYSTPLLWRHNSVWFLRYYLDREDLNLHLAPVQVYAALPLRHTTQRPFYVCKDCAGFEYRQNLYHTVTDFRSAPHVHLLWSKLRLYYRAYILQYLSLDCMYDHAPALNIEIYKGNQRIAYPFICRSRKYASSCIALMWLANRFNVFSLTSPTMQIRTAIWLFLPCFARLKLPLDNPAAARPASHHRYNFCICLARYITLIITQENIFDFC